MLQSTRQSLVEIFRTAYTPSLSWGLLSVSLALALINTVYFKSGSWPFGPGVITTVSLGLLWLIFVFVLWRRHVPVKFCDIRVHQRPDLHWVDVSTLTMTHLPTNVKNYLHFIKYKHQLFLQRRIAIASNDQEFFFLLMWSKNYVLFFFREKINAPKYHRWIIFKNVSDIENASMTSW